MESEIKERPTICGAELPSSEPLNFPLVPETDQGPFEFGECCRQQLRGKQQPRKSDQNSNSK